MKKGGGGNGFCEALMPRMSFLSGKIKGLDDSHPSSYFFRASLPPFLFFFFFRSPSPGGAGVGWRGDVGRRCQE